MLSVTSLSEGWQRSQLQHTKVFAITGKSQGRRKSGQSGRFGGIQLLGASNFLLQFVSAIIPYHVPQFGRVEKPPQNKEHGDVLALMVMQWS